MSIVYMPAELVKKLAPKKVIKRLVTKDLTLNRAALSMLARSGVLGKTGLETVAIKVINGYKKAYRREIKEGASKSQAREDALAEKALMVQRIQNAIVSEITDSVKNKYRGEFYEWLPSDAEEPDPEHQLKYGKIFQIGRGEAPGDRYGCRCGMNILVDEDRLKL